MNEVGLNENEPGQNETPKTGTQTTRGIMSVNCIEIASGKLGARELMKLKSRTRRSDDLMSIPEFKRRILEYIHIRSAENIPVRLIELNRVFQHPARRLGVSVKSVTNALLDDDLINELEQGGAVALFSTEAWNFAIQNGGEAVGMAARLMANIGL